jgi:hypothetical protein
MPKNRYLSRVGILKTGINSTEEAGAACCDTSTGHPIRDFRPSQDSWTRILEGSKSSSTFLIKSRTWSIQAFIKWRMIFRTRHNFLKIEETNRFSPNKSQKQSEIIEQLRVRVDLWWVTRSTELCWFRGSLSQKQLANYMNGKLKCDVGAVRVRRLKAAWSVFDANRMQFSIEKGFRSTHKRERFLSVHILRALWNPQNERTRAPGNNWTKTSKV